MHSFTDKRHLALRPLSSRAEQAGSFSSLPLLRKFGLRREKSLFRFSDFVASAYRKQAVIILLGCSFLLFAFSVNAQAPTPVPLAHGNVPGEPHHHLKIENEYIRAYYVEVPPHDETQLHQHDHDYFYVSLGDSDVVSAPAGKPEAHLTLKDEESHFTLGGFAHVARNLSDQPFKNITVEFLRPQNAPRNHCEKIIPGGEVGSCIVERRVNAYTISPWFETDEVRIDFVELLAKAGFQDVPGTDKLAVTFEQSQLNVKSQGNAAAELKGGGLLWLPHSVLQEFTNPGERPSHFLLFSFKDSGKAAK
jgi:hypothetical protein